VQKFKLNNNKILIFLCETNENKILIYLKIKWLKNKLKKKFNKINDKLKNQIQKINLKSKRKEEDQKVKYIYKILIIIKVNFQKIK